MDQLNPLPQKQNVTSHTQRFILFILLLALCFVIGRYFSSDYQYYKDLIGQFPLALSGLVFVAVYVGVTFFAWLSKDLFKIVGAVLFGAYWSTLFIWLAELANATILFHMSRRLGRGFIEEKFKGRSKFIDKLIENSGFWSVFAMRITLVPFRFQDLAYGLTKIPFRKYLLIVLLASPPRIFFIQFVLGAVGESIMEKPDLVSMSVALARYFRDNVNVLIFGFFYVVLIIVIMGVLKKKLS